MAVSRNYSSVAQPTTLAGSIDVGSTTIGVVTPVGYPSPPFTAVLDPGTASEELIQVTAVSAGTWTATRAIDGTSAQTHSIGAVVRHVVSARDFAESRTHEAASSGVHGITGSVVGTTDMQTLTSKTLTSPTITSPSLGGTVAGSPTFTGTPTFSGAVALSGGGTLSGTFAGSPTLSGTPTLSAGAALAGTFTGAPTFSGAPVFTGGVQFKRTDATDLAHRASLAADAQDRLQVQADGKLLWGSGSAATDTDLYRSGVGALKTDSALTVAPTGANGGLVTNVTNGAYVGNIADFQVGGVSMASIDQGGNLTAANINLGAWQTWTPTWSTVTGVHLPVYGNATVTGTYAKIGRTVLYSLGITFGSTTTFGASATTADYWSFTLPGGLIPSANAAGGLICGHGRVALSNAISMPVTVRTYTGQNVMVLYLAGGRVDGVTVTNTDLVARATPWSWTSGGSIQITGAIEVTT